MLSDQAHVVYHGDKLTGTPEWEKKVDAEIAGRPTARLKRVAPSPAEIALHRLRGAAFRRNDAAEVSRIDVLITQERKRNGG